MISWTQQKITDLKWQHKLDDYAYMSRDEYSYFLSRLPETEFPIIEGHSPAYSKNVYIERRLSIPEEYTYVKVRTDAPTFVGSYFLIYKGYKNEVPPSFYTKIKIMIPILRRPERFPRTIGLFKFIDLFNGSKLEINVSWLIKERFYEWEKSI